MSGPERSPTLGERRVDIDFNPSGDPAIDDLKRRAADLIDAVDAIPDGRDRLAGDPDIVRLKTVAQTEIESAAMWAVKAAGRSAAR